MARLTSGGPLVPGRKLAQQHPQRPSTSSHSWASHLQAPPLVSRVRLDGVVVWEEPGRRMSGMSQVQKDRGSLASLTGGLQDVGAHRSMVLTRLAWAALGDVGRRAPSVCQTGRVRLGGTCCTAC